jgi:hypothetical protein
MTAQPRGPKKTHTPRDEMPGQRPPLTPRPVRHEPTKEEIEKWYQEQGRPVKKDNE